MSLLGTAVLCVWNDVDPSAEADYNDWYRLEHIPERLAVPGMLRARRYRAAEGTPRYMALYEAASIEVLTSGAYRAQLASPTPWTRRVMPGFRLMQRGICSVLASGGAGLGEAAVVAHLPPQSDPGWADLMVAGLLGTGTVIAAHVWAVAPGEPASPTTALTQGGAVERPVRWVVMAEAGEISGLARFAEMLGRADAVVYPPCRLISTVTVCG